ncbi:MAG: peptidoglycan DD-metalloendopeptidase family protein [Pseudomonadota bacterium]
MLLRNQTVDHDSPVAAAEPAMIEPSAQALTSLDTAVVAESVANPIVAPESPPPVPAYDQIKLTVKSGDTLDQLFRRSQLSVADLMTIATIEEAKEPLRVLRPGDELIIAHEEGRLMSLTRHIGIHQTLSVVRDDSGQFVAEMLKRPVEYRQSKKHAVITDSLFVSAANADMSDKVIMNIAGIFAWDIDFVYDIRVGDEFYVIYEELWQDGKKVDDGEILAAEFINQGRSYKALRYVKPEGRSDYYDDTGRSVRKAFVRAPVDFKRISSQFNPNRRHPVLNTIRAHRGVDYAAPIGTPIMAAGDGKIIVRERQRGFGNVVMLQHGGNIVTVYAHMNNFRRGQRVGSRVKQGQVIGFVGKTGLVTGAHLHYEYRVNGVHRNPRTVSLPQADPIAEEFRDDFNKVTAPMLAELEQFKRLTLASASASTETGTL